jgi:hypothetical protein
MSFILVPKSGEDVQVNGWNWRPTLELLLEERVISEEQYGLMGAQYIGGQVDDELANRIADVAERKLKSMNPGDRMRADLTVTSEPKTPLVFTPGGSNADEISPIDTYSASYEWLTTFADFCRRSGGFEVL